MVLDLKVTQMGPFLTPFSRHRLPVLPVHLVWRRLSKRGGKRQSESNLLGKEWSAMFYIGGPERRTLLELNKGTVNMCGPPSGIVFSSDMLPGREAVSIDTQKYGFYFGYANLTLTCDNKDFLNTRNVTWYLTLD